MIATVTLNPSLDEWITVPSIRVGELNRADDFARYPGGKGLNVSRVLHTLRVPTIAYGLAGGEDGAILRVLMNRLAIRHEFVAVDGTTRNNYKVRTRSPRAVTEINTPGPTVRPGQAHALQRIMLRRAPRYVALSGSLPPGLASTTYVRWITALRRAKIPAVLDTSGDALRSGLRAKPWLIKPNRQEAEAALGRRLSTWRSMLEGARALLSQGPSVVILSLAGDGALLAARQFQGIWWAKPPAVKVDSAVGAGDSLVGGMLAGMARHVPLLEAFRLGVACGTATALTPGTELCHRRDIDRILPRVRIRQVG